ncbi:MAG: Fe-S protein assembly chaperone HscA, partial [Saprospiraceae bacterium]|nr:Fe-S protein assembly chaperone HscA [Saprospiraceae bacterium]
MALISIDLKSGELQQANNEIIIGIDLGTTNSLVAYMLDGKPVTIKDEHHQNALVPSIIHFAEPKQYVVGIDAKNHLITHPERTIFSVKRLMGKSYNDISNLKNFLSYRIIETDDDRLVKIQVDDVFYSPIELSALILGQLKKIAEEKLNVPISKAVITVPAYFNDTQRQATRDAGKLAGLDVMRVINEPTAAALAYGLDKISDEENIIAVYDLGGGTFDMSILRLQDGVFEVLSTNGDTFLGGDDLDKSILDFWLSQNKVLNDKFLDDKNFQQELRLLAEKAKKTTKFDQAFSETVADQVVHLNIQDLNKLAMPLIEKTLIHCLLALKDAKLTTDDIRHIVMVGGSTRLQIIQEKVRDFFGKPVFNDINPDEVVALGAAIQADVLAGNQKDVLLLDVTPLSLGIETIGNLMDVILPRNSKVPTRVARQYTTSVDGQKNLKIAIYQGERDLVTFNRKLGEFILSNIPPMPAGLPKIEIRFLVDTDGILVVSAEELRSGVKQEIEIRSQYGISEEEMAKMLIDSIHNAKEDMQYKVLTEATNEANNIILSSKKFLTQHDSILSNFEKNELSRLLNELEQSILSKDKDIIHVKMEELNKFAAPIAHEVMNTVIAEAIKGKK